MNKDKKTKSLAKPIAAGIKKLSSANVSTKKSTSKSAASAKSKTESVSDTNKQSKVTRKSAAKSTSKTSEQNGKELADWRPQTLTRMRLLIQEADPEAIEELKWGGVPVWSHDGIICTGETYKKVIKLTFAKGASLEDPSQLFNSSLEGNTRRAIDIHEDEQIDETAFKKLIKAAVAFNVSKKKVKSQVTSQKQVKLLSGGNPQIAKADGNAPVQAYIDAMPSWKQDVGRRIDSLIMRDVSDVKKAIKWNTPFYGMEGQGWFLSFHCFSKYVKVAFFQGESLKPKPPEESKHKEVRYLHIYEGKPFDEKQLTSWIKQAAAIPGWNP